MGNNYINAVFLVQVIKGLQYLVPMKGMLFFHIKSKFSTRDKLYRYILSCFGDLLCIYFMYSLAK